MRSKRLAADGKGGQQDDASEDKKIQPAAKKRKASCTILVVHVSSAADIRLGFLQFLFCT